MDARRAKRKAKKKKQILEEIPCIVFLATNERESFDLAEFKENKQLNMINEYADAHGLVPIRIVRKGCMGQAVTNKIFNQCIERMHKGRARAILLARMEYISSCVADSYYKVGQVRENGFRIFTVDEGELSLGISGKDKV